MKGHVGGGPGYRWPLGVGVSVKAKPFHVLIYALCKLCAGTAPRDAGLVIGFSPDDLVGHKLESLILAQNERWRHA
jgi:hypothetical protein